MKAIAFNKHSQSNKKMNLNRQNICIPSERHVKHLPQDVLKSCPGMFTNDWWLNSPGNDHTRVKFVDKNGCIDDYGHLVLGYYGVRPMLRIDNMNDYHLKIFDKFEAAGSTWTVISDECALCDGVMDYVPFNYYLNVCGSRNTRYVPNDYHGSDIEYCVRTILRKFQEIDPTF